MGDAALVTGRADKPVRIVEGHEPHRAGPHGAAVAGGGRRRPGLVPGHALGEPERRGLGRPAPPDDPAFREYGGDAPGVVGGIEALARDVALHELAGELGIVGVLAEGERRAAGLAGPARLEHLIDIAPAPGGGMALDHEAERIAQRLADE